MLIVAFMLLGCKKDEESLTLYTIKGTIIDKQSEQPIPNIKIIRTGYQLLLSDTTYTDNYGQFEFEFTDYYSTVDKPVTITATDVDGVENGGLYKLFSMDVIFSAKDQTKNTNSDTYAAIAEKTVKIMMSK